MTSWYGRSARGRQHALNNIPSWKQFRCHPSPSFALCFLAASFWVQRYGEIAADEEKKDRPAANERRLREAPTSKRLSVSMQIIFRGLVRSRFEVGNLSLLENQGFFP